MKFKISIVVRIFYDNSLYDFQYDFTVNEFITASGSSHLCVL